MIVETEAYSQEEEACHGFNRRTPKNDPLFGNPGSFYIYKSYGIHHCLNIVTGRKDFASGVLIRSVEIYNQDERAASGPGLVTKKFDIDTNLNYEQSHSSNSLWIKKWVKKFTVDDLVKTTRIGISKASNLKWRWYLRSSRSISKREKGDKKPINKKNTSIILGQ